MLRLAIFKCDDNRKKKKIKGKMKREQKKSQLN